MMVYVCGHAHLHQQVCFVGTAPWHPILGTPPVFIRCSRIAMKCRCDCHQRSNFIFKLQQLQHACEGAALLSMHWTDKPTRHDDEPPLPLPTYMTLPSQSGHLRPAPRLRPARSLSPAPRPRPAPPSLPPAPRPSRLSPAPRPRPARSLSPAAPSPRPAPSLPPAPRPPRLSRRLHRRRLPMVCAKASWMCICSCGLAGLAGGLGWAEVPLAVPQLPQPPPQSRVRYVHAPPTRAPAMTYARPSLF